MEKQKQPEEKRKRQFILQMEDDGTRFGGLELYEQADALKKLVHDAGYTLLSSTETWPAFTLPKEDVAEEDLTVV